MPVLRRIIWSDDQPSRDPEDFNVMDGEQALGRIYGTTDPRGEGYAWLIYGASRHGFAPTRDEAAAEWKAAYERWQTEKSAGR